ncbi:nuclear transport factor 2 family protein [Paraburkholderia sp. BCC1886]|uniref:nuclear transport factor 2 family protein n=1 Tax=Paraburkholderia sp. BCC1886 TaxID=2562670 RepID=UPI0011837D92|nr:nuclear transport factor 2 family protein [Paraburkholderia sp. BCC1886]
MKFLTRLTLIALLIHGFSSAAFASPADDEATLKAMEQTWITAVSTTDRVTLEKLLDDAFIETSANGQRRSKSDLLLASPPQPGSSQTLADLNVRLTGDTAIVTGINRFKPNPGAQPVDYSFTDVFIRRAEGWRILSSQMTRR